jgi:hypothetical protein
MGEVELIIIRIGIIQTLFYCLGTIDDDIDRLIKSATYIYGCSK